MSGEEVIVRDSVKSLSPVMRLMSAINIPIPKVTPIMATIVCLGLANKCVFAISRVRYMALDGFELGSSYPATVIGQAGPLPQHLNTSTLKHLNTSTLQHFNT
jgi:hypothetical protein